MNSETLTSEDRLLWSLAAVVGLLLHLLLANFLWAICNTYDEAETPALKLIRLAKPAIAPLSRTSAPEVAPPAKIIDEPAQDPVITQPEPIIERTVVEPTTVVEAKPLIEPKTVIEPKPETVIKSKPAVKAKPAQVVKKKPQAPALPKPAPVKKVSKPITPAISEPAVQEPVIESTRPTDSTAIFKTQSRLSTDKTAPATSTSKPAMAISSNDFSTYLQKIYRQLERAKKYPARARRRGISGKVTVAFSINQQGKAVEAAVIGKSPRELSQAALKLVNSQQFSRPPEGWNHASRIEMQINYYLR